MSVSSDIKSKNWVNNFRTTHESSALNKVHNQVVNLFAGKTTEELDKISCQNNGRPTKMPYLGYNNPKVTSEQLPTNTTS